MSDRAATIGRLGAAGIALLLLLSCNSKLTQENRQSAHLAACTASGSSFATRPLQEWPAYYHGTVAQVVESHVQRMNSVTSVPLLCTAEDAHLVESATDALQDLAAALPAWRSAGTALRESDMASVLLEFLRIYECSLNERRQTRWVAIPESDVGKLLMSASEEQKIIERELTLAQPALERTLLVIGGLDRLRPLSYGTECLKRTSLDLRNVLGLAAEASACLPRAWDARGSLRDLAD